MPHAPGSSGKGAAAKAPAGAAAPAQSQTPARGATAAPPPPRKSGPVQRCAGLRELVHEFDVRGRRRGPQGGKHARVWSA